MLLVFFEAKQARPQAFAAPCFKGVHLKTHQRPNVRLAKCVGLPLRAQTCSRTYYTVPGISSKVNPRWGFQLPTSNGGAEVAHKLLRRMNRP